MQSVAGKTYGTVSADRQREMSGLEFVRGLVEGTLPLNTIAETLGYDIIEAENGRVIVVRTEAQSPQPGWHRAWRSRSDNA
jgi:hypothetical protein